jgi:hypothetical protein
MIAGGTPARSSEQIQTTRNVLASQAGRRLSDQECTDSLKNAAGFFAVLAEWAAREQQEPDGTRQIRARRTRPASRVRRP